MKRLSMLFFLAALGALVAPQGMMSRGGPGPAMMGGPFWPGSSYAKLMGSYEKTELAALRSELADKTLGEVSGSELEAWAERFSVARQKDAWLARSMAGSMLFPGRGQFMNGQYLEGSLFTAAHIATFAGAVTAWYLLLPADLKFDQLNYYSSSLDTIKARWEAKSLEDYLPSIGAMAGGMVLDMLWRVWSAHGALAEAHAAIDGGKLEFRPLDGSLGMGFRLRY